MPPLHDDDDDASNAIKLSSFEKNLFHGSLFL